MTNDYPRRRVDICSRVVAGERLVLDLAGARIHQLNATASYIWDRCDGHRTVSAIAAELTDLFQVDDKTAREAVQATLRQLDELGLLDHARV